MTGPVDRGRFITFEGGEGSGKSTQARLLAERLTARGEDTVLTREPGGSSGAETLRNLLVNGEPDRWSATAETLLMYAARSDHLERTIRPALLRGAWVICDRFMDSTRAYQGAGGGASTALIAQLERSVLLDDLPDLTLIFDLPVEQGLARAKARGQAGEARFEAKGRQFHQRLREAYRAIAEQEPMRCVVIDASPRLETVAATVWKTVNTRLPVGKPP
jgi:dTMP kinase